MSGILIVIVVVAAVFFYGISLYNSLVGLRRRVQNAFVQIDVQLQRRYDLIPNIVETAKAYMKHERDTLEAVIQARNTAQQAAQQVAADPSDGSALKTLLGAETALNGMMTKFFALAEDYPDLKANQNIALVQEELASTENKISFARQAYNDAVMLYNTRREVFPSNIIARSYHFKEAEQWQLEEELARKAVKLSFE